MWFCNFLGELDEDAFVKVVHAVADFENDDEESVGNLALRQIGDF